VKADGLAVKPGQTAFSAYLESKDYWLNPVQPYTWTSFNNGTGRMHLNEAVVPCIPRTPGMVQFIFWYCSPGKGAALRQDMNGPDRRKTAYRCRRRRPILNGFVSLPALAVHRRAVNLRKRALQPCSRSTSNSSFFTVSVAVMFPLVVQANRLPDYARLRQKMGPRCRNTDEVDAGTRPVGALPHQPVRRSLHLFRERSRL
jgi:hypothetical protein